MRLDKFIHNSKGNPKPIKYLAVWHKGSDSSRQDGIQVRLEFVCFNSYTVTSPPVWQDTKVLFTTL